MASFGKYLFEQGAVTRAQLDTATQALVIFGGRIGTNLVEAGTLRLDELEQHLSKYLGVATPPADWIENPERDALSAVPASLVKRHSVLPLRLEKWTLHVAMADPRDPNRIDEIAFATGLRIEPYVLAEVHLLFLLERHFGIPRAMRFAAMGSPIGASGRTSDAPRQPSRTAAPEDEEAARQRDALGIRPLECDEELIDHETFSTLHQKWQLERPGSEGPYATHESEDDADAASPSDAPPEPPAGNPLELAALETDLTTAADHDAVSAVALRLAGAYASTAAFFIVRDGMVHGSRAVGAGLEERVRGVLVPRSADSILAAPAETGDVQRGAPARGGFDARLFRALGRSEARDVAVFPIKIAGRVVNLLYVDNGSQPLAETAFAALGVLCQQVAAAYERLIVARKRRHC